jgi:hypothetical protein
MKPNDKPVYVFNLSNHPQGILRNILRSVNRRLSAISANDEALKQSGYSFELEFDPQVQARTKKKQTRKRKIIYFNPPFSQNVQSNIGEQFFKTMDKCFPSTHPLKKIININTAKLSYRCMPNIQVKISAHSSKAQQEETIQQEEALPCNCRKLPCPMDGKCQSAKSIVYKASIMDENGNTEHYTGLTKNTVKERYYGPTASFNSRDSEHLTTLSTHVGKLKDEGTDYDISTRSELYSNCRHRLCPDQFCDICSDLS